MTGDADRPDTPGAGETDDGDWLRTPFYATGGTALSPR